MKPSPVTRIASFLLLLMACGGAFAAEAKRPNVIFIIADDMYRDMLNCTPEGKGRNVTPTLDRLAAEGVVMLGQHIVSPVCTPKVTIYEGGIRACAFANWPGKIAAGTIIKEPLHAVDWYPTLLKLAGAPAKQELPTDGLDIWPVLTQGANSPHDALRLMGTVPGRAAVRMGDWKLLLNASEKNAEEAFDDSAKPAGSVELYNLAEDIGETKNIAASQPAKAKELRARLDVFLKDAVQPGKPTAKPAPRKTARSK